MEREISYTIAAESPCFLFPMRRKRIPASSLIFLVSRWEDSSDAFQLLLPLTKYRSVPTVLMLLFVRKLSVAAPYIETKEQSHRIP